MHMKFHVQGSEGGREGVGEKDTTVVTFIYVWIIICIAPIVTELYAARIIHFH